MDPQCIGQTWRARAPATAVLFFRPRGCCKALLGHCLATQLGAMLLRLGANSLAASCPVKGVRLLQAAFVAGRPPAVLLITGLDLLLPVQD